LRRFVYGDGVENRKRVSKRVFTQPAKRTVIREMLGSTSLFGFTDINAELYSSLPANNSRPLQTKVRDLPRCKDFR
jgi:hypothetical protein